VDALPALACAFCWALSPVLTLRGLEGIDNPLLGITLGLVVSVLGYGLAFAVVGRDLGLTTAGREALVIKLVAGILVGLSTWARWAALDSAAVAVVLTLNLLSVPVVLIGAPLVSGRHVEHVTARVWLGAALVVGGSLLLIAVA
jgi:uncharacterized membrane protein